MDNVKKLHNNVLKMKCLKNQVVRCLNKVNSKLAAFFDECTLYKDGKSVMAYIDNGNVYIKKVLDSDKHIILDAITDVTALYNNVEFIIFEEDDDVYHLRCSSDGCINLPKSFIDRMKWKVGDRISVCEHTIHDTFGIGKDPEGLDLMKKEDRDILFAHEEIKF